MPFSAFTPSVLTLPSAAGTGQGELNLITNSSAATDVSTGWAAVGLTPSRLASGSPLDPVVPTGFQLSSTASAQTFTTTALAVPSSLQNRKLKVEFWYKQVSGTGYKLDVSSSSSFATRYPLTTDSGGVTNLPATAGTVGKFTCYFDADSSGSIYVRFSSLGTGVIQFTQVVVGPGIQPQGAVVGEWQNFVSNPTATGFGTIANTNWKYRRVGDSAEIRGVFQVGTVAASTAGITLPSGFSVDTTKVTAASTNRGRVGRYEGGSATAASISSSNNEGVLFSDGSSTTTLFFAVQTDASGYVKNTGNQITGSSQYLLVEFTVPIAEWAGSGTVQLAQNDVEYAYNTSTSTTASDTTSFGYGPGGAVIQNITAGLTRTVRFQTPIQATDKIFVEVNNGIGNGWINSDTFFPNVVQNTAQAGITWNPNTTTPTTDVDVSFRTYADNYGATTYGAAGRPWSTVGGTWKWRVRKSSAGAAVGFGLYQPGVSAGLVSSSGLAGRADGQVVPSGYVGQKVPGVLSTAVTLGSSFANLSSTPLTLTSGVYLIIAGFVTDKATTSTSGYARYRIQNTTDSTTIAQGTVHGQSVSGGLAIPLTFTTYVVVPQGTAKVFHVQGTDPNNSTFYVFNRNASGIDSQNEFYAVRIA